MGMLLRLVLLLYCSVHITHAEFFKDVKDIEWTLELGPDSAIKKGNGVVITPDGQHLLVTTSEGRFHSIRLSGDTAPKESSIASLDPPEDTVACSSEPVPLLQSDPTVAVYAVHAPSVSYVRAVRILDATLVWQVEVPGWIAGSPVEGQDGFLYVTHNTITTGAATTGQVSVIRDSQVVASLPAQRFTQTPFAPPAVNSQDEGDVVVFGEAREGGLSQFGALYSFTWSPEHAERNGVGDQSYVFRRLQTTVRSGATAPVLADDLRIYMGTQGSLVVGWDQGAQNSLLEQTSRVTLYPWGSLMELDPFNNFSPIPASPVLSTDQKQLFVVGAGPEVAASDLVQGYKLWEDSTLKTPVRARAVYYEDEDSFPVVYFVESSGTIHQKEPDTGKSRWSFELDSVVEGEFTVSPGGNLLIAGDTKGTLRAITVAEFETKRPTSAPKGSVPAVAPPTQAPASQPKMTESPVVGGGGLRTTIAPAATTNLTPSGPTLVLPMITLRPTSTDENASLKGDDIDSKFTFGLIPTISAAIGVGVLCCLTCIVMILRLRLSRRKKTRASTNKAVEDEDKDTARRLEAEQLAYEQECAQNEHELLDALAAGSSTSSAAKVVTTKSNMVSENKSWDTQSVTPDTQTSTMMPYDDSDHSRSFGFEVSVDHPSIGAQSTAELEEKLSAMVSPDEPSPIKQVDPSPIKKVQSYESSPISSMADKLRAVRSLDGHAPATMPSRELLEVRSFDDDSSASSKVSAFTDVLAGAGGAVAAAVGAAVTALSFAEEKKETDSPAVPMREMRRVKSADTLFTDLSNPTQPGRIRTQGARPASPSGMVSVDSASIYLEEQSSASEVGGSESLLSAPLSTRSRSSDDKILPDPAESLLPHSAVEDALSGSGSGVETDTGTVRSDCPEDEGQGVLRPGSAYLSRYNEKKSNDNSIPDDSLVKTDRTRPIYKGVSVRPSTRSRAGIFSRRQPQLATFTDDEGDSDGTDQRQKLPINLGPKRSERLKAQRSLSPNNSMSTSEESPPKFTTANYYVEEPDDNKLYVSMEGDEDPNLSSSERKPRRRSKGKRKQKAASNTVAAPHPTESPASDAWNSFLSELTKVESTFFGSNAFMSTGESTTEEAARPDDAVPDEESAQLPPQPPRTFYA